MRYGMRQSVAAIDRLDEPGPTTANATLTEGYAMHRRHFHSGPIVDRLTP